MELTNELTGKEKRYLRGLGNRLKPVVFIGQNGVNETVLQAIDEAFSTQELIKIKLQEGFPGERRETGRDLAEKTQTQLVQVLGKTILLYREHPEEPRLLDSK